MRCFVTGGAGFIGARAVTQMVADGWTVAVMARPGEDLRRLLGIRDRIEIVEADLSDTERVGEILSAWQPEACLHCAWYAEPGKYLDSLENIACVAQSLALLNHLIAVNCTRVVMLGTCAEYDTSGLGKLCESSITRPATLYAAAKLATCLLGEQRAAQVGIRFAWARMFYLFGPDEDPRRVVPALIHSLLKKRAFEASSGEQLRDYLHVDDAAAGLLALLRGGASGIFNICSGVPVPVRQLLETIGGLMGQPDLIRLGTLPDRPWDPQSIYGDCSRLRNFGWQPRYELPEALQLAIDYWRANGR